MFLSAVRRFLVFITLFGLVAGAAHGAGVVRVKHVELELLAEQSAFVPGKTTTVALRMKHDPEWHTYWINSGEAGMPTTIAWTLPEGWSAGPLQFPVPHLLNSSGVLTYGYEGEILVLAELSVPASAKAGETVAAVAKVEWLMCKEACLPGETELRLELLVATSTSPTAGVAEKISTARAALPPADPAVTVTATQRAKVATLRVTVPGGLNAAVTKAALFSNDGSLDVAEFQPVKREGGAIEFTAKISAAAGEVKRVAGLLVADAPWRSGGRKEIAIDVPLTAGGAVVPAATAKPAPRAGLSLALLGLALGGGLILNLMPCVFPVLGIKILGFVQQAGQDARQVKLHGLAYTFGVLVSFWVLAGTLLALRPDPDAVGQAAGQGWGFQLQYPGFDFAVAVVMLLFALSLSGVFEIGASLIGAGSQLQAKQGLAGSFFSGVLATVVSSPCSAPLLGAALGAALALPALHSLLVFTLVALGLALPYLILSIFPKLVKFLPRPGAWMETFKQFMAFPLYGFVGYLLWVLAGLTHDSENALLLVVFALTLVALAAWIYGRWAVLHRTPPVRWAARLIALAVLVGGLALGWPAATNEASAATPASSSASATGGKPEAGHLTWQPWSEETITKLRAENRVIYVDFTARWCVTCQVNKAVVFGSSEVLAEFAKANVATVRADWTSKNPQIFAELQKHGRAAVPTNLVYLPGRADPIVLPEALTPGIVLDALRTK